jgi:hypothetical protein
VRRTKIRHAMRQSAFAIVHVLRDGKCRKACDGEGEAEPSKYDPSQGVRGSRYCYRHPMSRCERVERICAKLCAAVNKR